MSKLSKSLSAFQWAGLYSGLCSLGNVVGSFCLLIFCGRIVISSSVLVSLALLLDGEHSYVDEYLDVSFMNVDVLVLLPLFDCLFDFCCLLHEFD